MSWIPCTSQCVYQQDGVCTLDLYNLFEDFEKNKDVVYTFINALTDKKVKDKQEG